MRLASKARLRLLLTGGALIVALPAIGQDAPESILPPGFGDPVEQPPQKGNQGTKPLDSGPDSSAPGASTLPIAPLGTGNSPPVDGDALNEGDENSEDETTELQQLQDLPAGVRRSTARVGLLSSDSGGLGEDAFGAADGKYLSVLLRKTRAPLASRWASILLRRALLSDAATPRGVSGSDWSAERAWLLLRMGEADAARMLVQKVDVDQYTPKMFQVAMQSSLATADPAALCPMVEPASEKSNEPAWTFARAICSALSGESAQASAQIDAARARGPGRGIDGVLAEKVVGAGGNTRRAVTVEWDNVNELTAWRFGMANATAAEIPDRLLQAARPQVLAWYARVPLVAVDKRLTSAETAAALGVLSSSALVDFYGAVSEVTDAADSSGTPPTVLKGAYSAEDIGDRLSAIRSLWSGAVPENAFSLYARQILTARAAARIPAKPEYSGDADQLIASMFSAGLDRQAVRWVPIIGRESDGLGWALLAVGAPGPAVSWSRGAIDGFQKDKGATGNRGAFLFAAMAGLGRMSAADAEDMSQDLGVPIDRQDAWSRALERAVLAREPGTVAVLSALGLQGGNWKSVSPAHLYHVVSALRRIGLGAEARMIAAEALTRA
jgi:hypothetical protein